MTRSIQILSLDLASQIAAGEVVERPASIVKELIENSLDAGATRITVAIAQGGLTAIIVTDDGHGMSHEDAPLCLYRHATSKLRAITDLDEIASYGFRGEALPSISSVSRLRVTTRCREEDAGVELFAAGTTKPQIAPKGAPVGTTVEVRDLFFNVPARRKFLKSSNTESGHVTEVLAGAALARPDVSFELLRDGRRVRSFPRAASRAERVAQVLEEETFMICQGTRGPLTVEAFLSPADRARQGAQGLRLIVNGRVVRDRALAATVAHAYGSILERGRYPRGALFLDLPARLVDVNVHPQKVEVRFAEARPALDAVHGVVARALSAALSAAPSGPSSASRAAPGSRDAAAELSAASTRAEDVPAAWGAARRHSSPSAGTSAAYPSAGAASRQEVPSRGDKQERHLGWGDSGAAGGPGMPRVLRDPTTPISGARYLAAAQVGHPACGPELDSHPGRDSVAPSSLITELSEDEAERPSSAARPPSGQALRLLTQVRQTYLVCEGQDGLYVLDQHATAERGLFHQLRLAYHNRTVATQALLFPWACDVNPKESAALEERRDDIARMGLDVRVRGPDQVSVHGVPKVLAQRNPERVLGALLRQLSRAGERASADVADNVLAAVACHAAVRAGDVLSATQAQALLSQLEASEPSGSCPHGRPIVAFTGWLELERKSGRR